MSNLTDLIAQREALEEQINLLSKTQRSETIERVRALMREHGLTPADLGNVARGIAKGASTPKKVAAKYRDDSGNTWSGRGLKPKWMQAAIVKGKKIEDFAV